MNKTDITIGIPAFNEEVNIGYLIESIYTQKLKKYIIKNIIVASDGSTDNTVKIVKQFKSSNLKIFNNKKREGLATMLNQIIAESNTEILILLNADTILQNKNFLEKLISPISEKKVDLVSSNVLELTPITFFEKILFVSTRIKNYTFEKYNNGDNVYTCRGLARAFSKNLYKNIQFHSSVGEDAYSYFYCILNGYKYEFAKSARIYFRLPNNFSDHLNQSSRFFKSRDLMIKKFGYDKVKSAYRIPRKLLIKSIIAQFFKYPLYTTLYLCMLLFIRIFSLINDNKSNDLWKIPKSSKNLK